MRDIKLDIHNSGIREKLEVRTVVAIRSGFLLTFQGFIRSIRRSSSPDQMRKDNHKRILEYAKRKKEL